MYYNNERKETYFDFLKKLGRKNIEGYIFRHVSAIEEMWNKDVCDFTLPEIQKVLASFNVSSKGALAKNVSILKTYTDWCCQNKLSLDNINHYTEISSLDLDKYINGKKDILITKEELYNLLYKLQNDSDKFFLLALFEGVKSEDIGEIFLLTPSAINHEERTITFSYGEKKTMSQKLYNLALRSSEETEYYSMKNGSQFVMKLSLGRIINWRKNARSEELSALDTRVQKRLRAIRNAYDIPNLTIPRLVRAGLLDNVKEIIDELQIDKKEFFGKKYPEYIKKIKPNYKSMVENKANTKKMLYRYL